MSGLVHDYKKFVRGQNLWWMIAAVLLIGGELFFDIAERAIGRYLVWQNAGRQKIGRSWEAVESRAVAGSRLEQTQQEIRQRSGNLASLDDFDQLLQFVQSNQRAVLPLSQFAAIYRTVPEIFQPLLVSPDALLQYVSAGRAVSALCAFQNSTLEIFLLDAEDRSVYQSSLSREHLRMLALHGREQQLDLTRTKRFAARMLTADAFYRLLDELPADQRGWLLRQVKILTEPENRFTRMSISDEVSDGFLEIAFAMNAYRCRIYYLPEPWVNEYLLPSLNEDRFIKFD